VNFLADENIDTQVVERLRQEGHQVLYVAEMEPGITDDVVLAIANQESALLLTSDKDFGELVFRLRQLTSGVVLLRLGGLSPIQRADIVAQVVAQHAEELPEAFTVITEKAVRIRRLEP
jgi:predicted nuclease of predicted toxin-antitoxin system